mmetsp:Transcript_31894/g.48523  ORF Transcript_31894/g.48523 Transcript_31894/m.48523 type:complete len:737 (-) Transcript_31894:28-2238(-)
MTARFILILRWVVIPTVMALMAPNQQQKTPVMDNSISPVQILPAREPLSSFLVDDENQFSLLSWNILLPSSQDNWWCHKQYAGNVDMDKRQWTFRQQLIQERVLHSAADIVCIQEAHGDTFEDDFGFMKDAGYDHVLHKKFRFRCATFFLREKFTLEQVGHKDRALVTTVRCKQQQTQKKVAHIVNCHLSGGAAPERRLRQVHDALDQIRKWTNALEQNYVKQKNGNRPSPKNIAKAEQALLDYQNAGFIVCGDFNSDGNTAVRKLLVEGSVDPDWHEPQYPDLRLSSKQRKQPFGSFIDAFEMAFGGNVCDGDYGDVDSLTNDARPATYVVPNLASLLLLPISEANGPPRTEFGPQVAQGIAETLNLNDFCETEIDLAFEQVDHDRNGLIDQDEIQKLLVSAYVSTYGQQIKQERKNFFRGFGADEGANGLTKDQFMNRLIALQKDREGERKAFGLARGLGLQKLSKLDMEKAFESIDLDGNGLLDEEEFQTLLETMYVTIYGEEITRHRAEFFEGFQKRIEGDTSKELTRKQFTDRLLELHQELEGGRKGSQLAEVRTDADAQKMIERFTPLLQDALDEVFDKFSSNGATLTQEEVNAFLLKTNGQLGRGGTYRHTSAMFEKKMDQSTEPVELTRDDWYKVFARELAEGKWWQVVYDLEVCGSDLRSHHSNVNSRDRFYQGWLDYIYFQSLVCTSVQDVLTETERSLVYKDGDALPNEWHPSDHLPVAVIFSWN